MSALPALGRLRQKEPCEFKASLYRERKRSKKEKETMNRKEEAEEKERAEEELGGIFRQTSSLHHSDGLAPWDSCGLGRKRQNAEYLPEPRTEHSHSIW